MEQLRKNDTFEVSIEAYNSSGSGVARISGRAVFVPRTIVGERWRIVIVKVRMRLMMTLALILRDLFWLFVAFSILLSGFHYTRERDFLLLRL